MHESELIEHKTIEQRLDSLTEDYPVQGYSRGGKNVKAHTRGEGKTEAQKEKPKYAETTVVAKMIRSELKENFPNIKFSVRSKSYSGGSSISVNYTDGPGVKAVEKITRKFEGVGRNEWGRTYGNTFEHKGKLYESGAHYVTPNRAYSDEARIREANKLAEKWGVDKIFTTVQEINASHNLRVKNANEWFTNLLHQEMYNKDLRYPSHIGAWKRKEVKSEAEAIEEIRQQEHRPHGKYIEPSWNELERKIKTKTPRYGMFE